MRMDKREAAANEKFEKLEAGQAVMDKKLDRLLAQKA